MSEGFWERGFYSISQNPCGVLARREAIESVRFIGQPQFKGSCSFFRTRTKRDEKTPPSFQSAAQSLRAAPQNHEKRSAVQESQGRVAVLDGRQPACVLRLAQRSLSSLLFFIISGNCSSGPEGIELRKFFPARFDLLSGLQKRKVFHP